MNEITGESLSAFLDGELPRAEYTLLLKRIQRDEQLRAALWRYSAMGECLRGDAVRVSAGFTDRICAAVAREAASHGAPSMGLLARNRGLRRAGQVAGGLALAATVAGVAILLLQREQLPAGQQLARAGQDANPGNETVLIGGPSGDAGISYTVPAPADAAPTGGTARLTDYVLAHSEYSNLMGRRNVLSSVIGEDPEPVDGSDEDARAGKGKPGDPL